MPSLLTKPLAAFALAFAAVALCSAPVQAVEQQPAKAKKSTAKKKPAKAAEASPQEDEPDVADSTVVEYKCELGNTITIYKNEKDSAHIALRWKKKLYRLARVGTTTGALRFENLAIGLTWIGIPSKGILLDSKLGRQLANNCQTPEQAAQAAAQG